MAKVITAQPILPAPGVVTPDDVRTGITPASDKAEGYVPPSEPNGFRPMVDPVDLDGKRKMLRDYVDLKTVEIEERLEARRYYHAKQWSDAELAVLREEKRPDIVYNRIAKKINGVIGLLERLRQDPKAYPRTPNGEEGANLASQCLRFVLDSSQWESKLSDVIQDLSVDGIGGWEMGLEDAGDGSMDPTLAPVNMSGFFYDPRSFQADFSDARYMGIAKWMSRDEAMAFMPDQGQAITESIDTLSTGGVGDAEALDPDKENLWWDTSLKKIRIIELWYREGNQWLWSIYTGATELQSGESPFVDGKGQSVCRYVMQSANVDELGNRYGFIRNLKGPQDEINHRRSKALHAFNTQRLLIEDGRITDVEAVRREMHRPDGIIALPDGQKGKMQILSNTDVGMANVQLLEEAKQEIENYGVNPALLGQGLDNKSGRAIALLQQAAIAELGPFIVRIRAMKLRVYSLAWEAIRKFWTAPRYIRVTGDEETGEPGFIPINQPQTNDFGMPTGAVMNPVSKVVVDFVLDEGPDTVTLRQDALMAVTSTLSGAGASLPPVIVVELSRVIMSLTDLPPAEKKRIMEAYDKLAQPQPPNPLQLAGEEIQLRQGAAKVQETEASAALKAAQAEEAGMTNAADKLAAEIALTGRASMV